MSVFFFSLSFFLKRTLCVFMSIVLAKCASICMAVCLYMVCCFLRSRLVYFKGSGSVSQASMYFF